MDSGKKTYVISRREGQILSFLFDSDGKTERIWAEDQKTQRPGNFYLARITKLVPGQDAAFIDYAPGKSGYLQLDTCGNAIVIHKGSAPALQAGDELVVSLRRINAGPKLPVFSGTLELTGFYSAVRLKKESPGISRKMDDESRKIWRDRALEWQEQAQEQDIQIIVRTNAQFAEADTVRREVFSFLEQFRRIREKAAHSVCPYTLYQQPAGWLRALCDLPVSGTEKIVISDETLFREAEQFLSDQGSPLLSVLRRYDDPMLKMESLYSLETRLKEALDRKVWLKSGGFLVIEQTEALVSIDVNAGKSSVGRKKETKEEQALKINLEAAYETARQLRLRNLGGIIIVDFVKMRQEEHRRQIVDLLQKCLSQDPEPCSAPEFTKLGLVEFTRKKTEKSLADTLKS